MALTDCEDSVLPFASYAGNKQTGITLCFVFAYYNVWKFRVSDASGAF